MSDLTRGLTPAEQVLATVARTALRRYQLAWLIASRRHWATAHLGSRQVGKDWTWAWDVACEMVTTPGTRWNVLSATARHAQQFLADVKRHLLAIQRAFAAMGLRAPDFEQGRQSVTLLGLDNDSTLESHAATVRAVVGKRGSFLLNEVGVLPRPQDVYEAALPVVTGQLDQGKTARLVLVGNATATGSFWHTFWTGSLSRDFTKLVSTWSDCFRDWLTQVHGEGPATRVKVEAWLTERSRWRQQAMGKAAFAQWYQCQWRAPVDGYLSPTLLDQRSVDPDEVLGGALWARDTQQVIGWDIGRHVHPSVQLPLLLHGPAERLSLQQIAPQVLWSQPYHVQHAALDQLVRQRQTLGVAIDSTGPGDSPTEEAQRRWPHLVQPVTLSPTSWWALASNVRALLEEGVLWLDRGDLDTRMDLEGVQILPGARVDKVALPERREGPGRESHGDRFSALALAAWAARGLLRGAVSGTAYSDALADAPRVKPRTEGWGWQRLGGGRDKGW